MGIPYTLMEWHQGGGPGAVSEASVGDVSAGAMSQRGKVHTAGAGPGLLDPVQHEQWHSTRDATELSRPSNGLPCLVIGVAIFGVCKSPEASRKEVLWSSLGETEGLNG